MTRSVPHDRHIGLVLVTLLLSILFVACNDNPTTVGSDYLPENVVFRTYTLSPEDFQFESSIAAVSNSSSTGSLPVLVGQTDDGGIARGLIALTVGSTRFNDLNTNPLTAASFRVRTLSYTYPASATGPVALDLVVLDGTFSNNQQWSDDLSGRIESAPVIGTYSGEFPDTSFVTFDMKLPETADFLKSYSTLDSDGSFRTLKTLAVRAHNDQRRIISFVGFTSNSQFDTLQPALTVTVGDTTLTLRNGVSNWIAKYPIQTGPGKLVLAGGMPIRTLMRLNLDSIPPTATIHQAKLTLYINDQETKTGTTGTTTFFSGYLADSTTLVDSTYLANNYLQVTASRPALDSTNFTDRFEFNGMAPAITKWQRYLRGATGTLVAENRGLVLALNRNTSYGPNLEGGTFDRLTFFGPDAADSSVRPSLVITYSIQSDAK